MQWKLVNMLLILDGLVNLKAEREMSIVNYFRLTKMKKIIILRDPVDSNKKEMMGIIKS